MRLLHGDGIFVSDPVRIVLFNAEGRVLARSDRTRSLDLICDDRRQTCKGYDRDTLEILKLAPQQFRYDSEPMPLAGSRGDDDPIWALEAEAESWGFVRRAAALPDILSALGRELISPPGSLAAVSLASVCFLLFLRKFPRRMGPNNLRFKLLAAAMIVLDVVLVLVAAMLALLCAGILGSSWLLLIVSALAGSAAAKVLQILLARSRRTVSAVA